MPADFAYPGMCHRDLYQPQSFCRAHGDALARGLGGDPCPGRVGGSKQGIKAMLSEEHVGHQLLSFLMVALMLVALLFSQSRGGILGILVRWWYSDGTSSISGRAISVGTSDRYCLLLVALVVFYGSRIGFDRIVERFMQIEGGAGGRMEIWEQTWKMVLDHPSGIGLGNYEVLEPVYVDAGRAGIWYRHAHNDYLQLVAEAGWAGAVPLVIGFFLFLIPGDAAALRRLGLMWAGFGCWWNRCSGGICSMAFHGFLDFNFQIPANQVYFVLLMALVEAGLWTGGAQLSGGRGKEEKIRG